MPHLFQAPYVALIRNLVATYHIISPKADTYVSHRWAHYLVPIERDLSLLSEWGEIRFMHDPWFAWDCQRWCSFLKGVYWGVVLLKGLALKFVISVVGFIYKRRDDVCYYLSTETWAMGKGERFFFVIFISATPLDGFLCLFGWIRRVASMDN